MASQKNGFTGGLMIKKKLRQETRLKGLLMKLKQSKIYNLKNLIFYFFLISGISINALACEDIIFSKTKVLITSKKNNKKHKFNVEIADTKQKREIGLQCKK